MNNLLIIFGTLLYSFLFSQSKDEKPKTIFNVEVNGTKTAVREGEDFKLDGKTIRISLSSEVTFSKRNISFNYPEYFTYEYEKENESLENWTISGNDFKIFYMIIKGNYSAEKYASIMKSKIANSTESEVEISLNKIHLKELG